MPADAMARPSPAATLGARVGMPVLLATLVVIESRAGIEALPVWIDGLATRFGVAEVVLLRLLMGVQITFAVSAILLGPWSRAISLVAASLLAFAAIAELSALVGRGSEATELLPPAILLAICGLLLPQLARRPATPVVRGSPAWRIVLMLAIATAGVATAARIPIPPSIPKAGSFSGEIVELAVEDWLGKTIPETGLGARVPNLTALTVEGRTAVVLYNPHCGSCHEFFEAWFGDPQPFRVIALEVPPEEGAVVVESDQPKEIACNGCERLSLPKGPLWLVRPPVLVLVEEGRVSCVAWESDQVAACLGPWQSAGS
jgi:hypothetical protein